MDREGNELLFNLIGNFSNIRRAALEIGCGDGTLLREIREKFTLYIDCLDPYPYSSYNDIGIVKLPAEKIELLRRRFDIIYSIRSFHHIESISDFIEGLKKTIAFNGVFILVDWKNGFNTGVSERYYTLGKIEELFKVAGFKVIQKGEGKSVFFIVLEFPFTNILFPLKGNKIVSLSEDDATLSSVNMKTHEIKIVNNIEVFPVIVSSNLGEKEKILNNKGIKIYYDRGGILKSLNFIKNIKNKDRCFWQSSCPVYYRYKKNEVCSYWVDNYCFVSNKNCLRYQMEERGEFHSDYMLPDGKIKK